MQNVTRKRGEKYSEKLSAEKQEGRDFSRLFSA
jgi:hypothetical protein